MKRPDKPVVLEHIDTLRRLKARASSEDIGHVGIDIGDGSGYRCVSTQIAKVTSQAFAILADTATAENWQEILEQTPTTNVLRPILLAAVADQSMVGILAVLMRHAVTDAETMAAAFK